MAIGLVAIVALSQQVKKGIIVFWENWLYTPLIYHAKSQDILLLNHRWTVP
jgi:hypothetical protein